MAKKSKNQIISSNIFKLNKILYGTEKEYFSRNEYQYTGSNKMTELEYKRIQKRLRLQIIWYYN